MTMICRGCGSDKNVRLEDSRTAYAQKPYTLWMALIHDDKIPDPNAPIPLCRECAAEHHAHWDEMWEEYHYDRY